MTDIPKDFQEAIEAIKQSSKESSVYVGCDSIRYRLGRKSNKYFVRYSTVIVLHRDSCRGGRYWADSFSEPAPKKDNLVQRLLKEVECVADVLQIVIPHLDGRYMEVHLDINNDEKHASYVAKSTAEGWIKGLGYIPKIKPDAWAATHAADHAVRHLGKADHNSQLIH